jgi:hypothetical protein
MRQPRNFVIEAEPRFTLFLSQFELSFLVFSNVRHLDLATKLGKHTILGALNSPTECRYLAVQVVKRCLDLRDKLSTILSPERISSPCVDQDCFF